MIFLFQGDRDIEDPEYHKKESSIILIYSIPFLIDFIIGILGLKWAIVLIEPEPQEPPMPEGPDLEMEEYSKAINDPTNDNRKCAICLDRDKDSMFYPCGHEVACFSCGQ